MPRPDTFKAILGADDLQICDAYQASGPCGVAVGAMATAYVPLAGVVDLKAECERLAKQEDEIVKYLASLQTKLSNEKFVSRAPAEIVAAERAKQAEFEDKLARVREQLAAFSAQA